MPVSQVQVGGAAGLIVNAATGAQNQPGGQFAEGLFNEFLPRYYHLTRAGFVFNLSTAVAGIAVPISTATAQTFGLWNPAGSLRNIVPLLYLASYVSGTFVGGDIGISQIPNVGSAIGAAGAPISAWTDTNPVNQLLGSGAVQGGIRGTLAATTIAATWLQTLGISEGAALATTPFQQTAVVYDFQGTLIVSPGNAIFTTASAASGALVAQTLLFAVLPQ